MTLPTPSPLPGGGARGRRAHRALVYWFIGLKTLKILGKTNDNTKNQQKTTGFIGLLV